MHWIHDRLGMDTARDKTDMEQGAAVAEPAPQNKMQNLRDQADGVINTLKENIKGLVKRGVNVADLLDKSQEMEEGANDFKRMTQKVARSYWWKNVKLMVVIMVVVLIIILIIILLVSGVIPVSVPVPPAVASTSKP